MATVTVRACNFYHRRIYCSWNVQ